MVACCDCVFMYMYIFLYYVVCTFRNKYVKIDGVYIVITIMCIVSVLSQNMRVFDRISNPIKILGVLCVRGQFFPFT